MALTPPIPLTPGRLLYLCYHQPLTRWRDRRDAAAGLRGEQAMRTAAAELPAASLPECSLQYPPCRFLTGRDFIHQTVFCAHSFEWACGSHIRLELFSDGTLQAGDIAMLRRTLPHATIADETATVARLDRIVPRERFPVLRALRECHPLARKLLDLHAGLEGPALYLDSDMLFFNTPKTLRAWLSEPRGEYFMQQDCDGLVSPREELERTFAQPLFFGVNSGIFAGDDDGFDWPALEAAAASLTAVQRSHRLIEQTLFALHFSRRRAIPLSARDYVLCNSRKYLKSNPPALRHYVSKAKALHTAYEWQRWLRISQSPPTV